MVHTTTTGQRRDVVQFLMTELLLLLVGFVRHAVAVRDKVRLIAKLDRVHREEARQHILRHALPWSAPVVSRGTCIAASPTVRMLRVVCLLRWLLPLMIVLLLWPGCVHMRGRWL